MKMASMNLTKNFELEKNNYHIIFEYTPSIRL
ncbi:hypothetical protein SAMN05216583_10825 [Selenomonas sp. KH1T6]|nr:hypothetical protein SAMN05216583_10825 [Selenomonas ruminantium]